mmetsp:Transcript_4854/g.10667  ORF Transcript_4854/g.10667 Transcript_4854/m.10667 type:complete len:242 (+) Transcript_4854:1092-1817(+)
MPRELVAEPSERLRTNHVRAVDHPWKLGKEVPDAVGHLLQVLATNVAASALVEDLGCLAKKDTKWHQTERSANHTAGVLEHPEVVDGHLVRRGISPDSNRHHVRLHVPSIDPDSKDSWKQWEQCGTVWSTIDLVLLNSSEDGLWWGVQRVESGPGHKTTVYRKRQGELSPIRKIATGVISGLRIDHRQRDADVTPVMPSVQQVLRVVPVGVARLVVVLPDIQVHRALVSEYVVVDLHDKGR